MELISVTFDNGRAFLTMDREGGNALNDPMVMRLRTAFREIRGAPDVRGAVLAGSARYFSTGLDLPELMTYDPQEFERFWWNLTTFIEELIAFPKPLVAAVTGQCSGCGCIIALCADHRIMTEGPFTIGLNEVAAGMIVPESFAALLARYIGFRAAARLILDAEMLHPHRAREMGLVDEICPTDEIIERAGAQLDRWLELDDEVWQKTKFNLRQPLCEVFAQDFRKLYGETLRHWWLPETRAALEQFAGAGKS